MEHEHILDDAAQRAQRYLAQISERRVAPDAAAITALQRLDEAFPVSGAPASETLALLDEIGSPATVANAGPRYFGFVTGGTLPVSVASNWLATAWDQNSCLWATSPIAAKLEQVTLDWLAALFGLPTGSAGAFVTGASMANFTALAAARNTLFARRGWNFKEQGYAGAPKLRVVVGAEIHSTALKALWLLGFGINTLERIPVDAQGRLRADALPVLDENTIVCIQAGNVNSGAFDPAARVCEKARAAGAWVHVDGAFGLWAKTAPEYAHLADGIEMADSWATDAHKWLNTPYDCGIALLRDPKLLRDTMSISAAYLVDSEQREPGHYTPELSRRARVVDVWAALRTLGKSGLADMITRNCRGAARFATMLRAGGLNIVNEVVLNQVLVAAQDDAATGRLIDAVQREGTCWCGGSVWQGRRVMRISVSSWATRDADIERSAIAILKCANGR
jgi:glutamate/tyrosine decarboxylase-like PLP-dependent enzyme